MLGSVESLELSDLELRISQLRGLALESSSLVINDLSEGGNHALLALHKFFVVPLGSILSECPSSWGRHYRLVLFCLAFRGRLFDHLEVAC